MKQTSFSTTDRDNAEWHVVDASQEVLGRMAARVAQILQGKHKPTYTPHADVGDFVVVINAKNVGITGRKADQKIYRRHTGYPGGLVETPYERMRERHPEDIIRLAVRRMMPKTTMGRHMLRKLKVYAGKDHPHHAQKPEVLTIAGAGSKSDSNSGMGE